MGQTSYRCNNKHGAGPEHSQQAVLFICCPTLVTALTAFTSLRPIIWQHQAGSATNLYSSGTQPVSLPHFRRSRFASWPALVHPGTVLMPRQDCECTVSQFQRRHTKSPCSFAPQHYCHIVCAARQQHNSRQQTAAGQTDGQTDTVLIRTQISGLRSCAYYAV